MATLDIGGVILFIFAVGLIILGTSWGGSTFSWDSVQVLAPIIVGGALLPVFFLYEFLLGGGRILSRLFPHQSPMLPLDLFSRKDTFVIAVIQFSAGAGEFIDPLSPKLFNQVLLQSLHIIISCALSSYFSDED